MTNAGGRFQKTRRLARATRQSRKEGTRLWGRTNFGGQELEREKDGHSRRNDDPAFSRGRRSGFEQQQAHGLVQLADANLWTQFSEENSPEFVKSFMGRVRLKNFLRRFAMYHYVVEYKLKEVYERQRTGFIPIDPKQDTLFKEQQQKDPDAFFRKHIEGLCGLALSNRVQPVLLFIPTLDQLTATNASNVLLAKQQVSRQLGVPLVDLTAGLRPRGKDLYLEADPVHLNAPGNDIIARRLLESVSKFVVPEP
jgi:hypothetical protein